MGKKVCNPNNVIYYDDYAELILTDRSGNEVGRTKIDIEELDRIKKYRWNYGCRNYVRAIVDGKQILLHRFIINCPEDKVVDHINGDTLDNRKCNLRICTQVDNMKNQKKNIRNTSGYKGVSWNKKSKAWEVSITQNGKRHYLGMYKDKEEAIKVRKEAEEKYFGEYNRGD